MESKVARELVERLALTANAKDHDAHMDLISQKVQLFGVPGFEVIDYQDWAAQCRHEFDQNILKSVRYADLNIRLMTPGRIMFTVDETVEATDGTVKTQGVEILIEKEADAKWRITQERVLSEDEARHYQLQRSE
jgi:hypothetical protein